MPVAEREVERFVLGARPPMDPDKSEKRLRKSLDKAAERSVDATGPTAAPVEEEHRRGLFGRRR